jgi:zinc transporter
MNEPVAKSAFAIGAQDTSAPNDRHLGIVPGLVWAFRFVEGGTAESVSPNAEIVNDHGGWIWLHFNLADRAAVEWLATFPSLSDEAREVLLCGDSYQRLHASDACIHGILADFVKRLDRPSNEIGHLHFVMTERLLISGRRDPLQAVEAVRRALETGHKLSSVAALIDSVIENVADAIDGVAEKLDEELDDIEELVLTPDLHDERQRLGKLRRTTVRLHRQLGGLRTLLLRVERQESNSLCPSIRLAASTLAQRLDSLDHEIVAMRDRARMLQEEVLAKTADQTNERLHWLAILTALFLPPTLVTGFFGMNLKGMPFAESEIGGLTAAVLCLGSAAFVYWLIRKKISRR